MFSYIFRAINAIQLHSTIWTTGQHARYERNEESGRVSLVSPFGIPHMGADYVAHIYKFTCIGSCVGGINRRATSIVFFLEHDGQIIGRQSLSCRICSCPKRDKKNQEGIYLRQSSDLDSSAGNVLKKNGSSSSSTSSPSLTITPIHSSKSSSSSESCKNSIFLVPVYGYENFMAVSKFAAYLDSVSGALQNTEYKNKRSKIMVDNGAKRIKIEPEDLEDSNHHLVIDDEK